MDGDFMRIKLSFFLMCFFTLNALAGGSEQLSCKTTNENITYGKIQNYLDKINCIQGMNPFYCSALLATAGLGISSLVKKGVASQLSNPDIIADYEKIRTLRKRIVKLERKQIFSKIDSDNARWKHMNTDPINENSTLRYIKSGKDAVKYAGIHNQTLVSRITLQKELRKVLAVKGQGELTPSMARRLGASRIIKKSSYAIPVIGGMIAFLDLFTTSVSNAGQAEMDFEELAKFINSSENDQCVSMINPEFEGRLDTFLRKEDTNLKEVFEKKIFADNIEITCGSSPDFLAIQIKQKAGPVSFWGTYEVAYYPQMNQVSNYSYFVRTEKPAKLSDENLDYDFGKRLRIVYLDESQQVTTYFDSKNIQHVLAFEESENKKEDLKAMNNDIYYANTFFQTAREFCQEESTGHSTKL